MSPSECGGRLGSALHRGRLDVAADEGVCEWAVGPLPHMHSVEVDTCAGVARKAHSAAPTEIGLNRINERGHRTCIAEVEFMRAPSAK